MNAVNWGKNRIEDQQEAKCIAGPANSQTKLLPATGDPHLQALQSIPGVSLVRNSSILSINSQANLANLLQQLVQIVATNSSPELMVAQLARAVGMAFQADGCAIVFSVSPSEQMQTACWLSDLDLVTALPFQESDEQFEKRVLEFQLLVNPEGGAGVSDSLVKIADNRQDSIWQWFEIPINAFPIQAVLEMRTQSQGRGNGIVSIVRSRPHLWTTYEIEQLELVSQHLAVIISQLQLQQQVSLQLQFQTVMNRLTMAIRSMSDLSDVLKLATDGIAQALNVQRAMLLRLKYSDPLFRSHSSEDLPKARVSVVYEWGTLSEHSGSNHSFWLSDCDLSQRAFRSTSPIAIDHKRHFLDETASTRVDELFHLDRFDALLVVPLESQGTVLGFLVFQSSQPRSWQRTEIDLVELVGAQVSNAIIQTETLRQVQSLVEKRTAELQQSLAIQAKLYERTRQQVEQLRQLNQLKDEFLDAVNHEFRTPLASMVVAIEMLRQTGTSSDRSNCYLDILEQQCAKEIKLVGDLLKLHELESKQANLQLEDIDVVALLENLVASFQKQWAAKGLSFEFECLEHSVRIRSDRGSLTQTLSELLTNAGKYSTDNSVIHLKLFCRREVPTNQVIVTVSNKGSEILPEELPHIFDKFRRCKSAIKNAVQGTGLGLALVKSLVQHLNGTISASSAPTENSQVCETCFSLTLPQSIDVSKL